MKLSLSWIKDYVKIPEDMDLKKLAYDLTMPLGGPDDVKRFLANLGFVDGTKVTVVSEIHGDLIVNVKDSRIAINREMAGRIMV